MRMVPLCALMVLGCSTAPSTAPVDHAASVGGSAEALRKLGQGDAVVVEKCRALVASCNADAGAQSGCDDLARHCDALAGQLESDRSELEQCLEAAAACEQTASDPADCEQARAACTPADRQFRTRRGRTMECSNEAERCLDPGARRGPFASGADGAVPTCDDDATDFVGCCRGNHGQRGDAGARDDANDERAARRFGGFQPLPGPGNPDHDGRFGNDDDERADGGVSRRPHL
jgi:hypothetical protein